MEYGDNIPMPGTSESEDRSVLWLTAAADPVLAFPDRFSIHEAALASAANQSQYWPMRSVHAHLLNKTRWIIVLVLNEQ